MDVETRLQELESGLKEVGMLENHPHCSVDGCDELCDITSMGVDSSCPYHRLLYDHWMSTIAMSEFPHVLREMHKRRQLFGDWMDEIGKEECNRIVDNMSIDGINWIC